MRNTAASALQEILHKGVVERQI